MRVLYIGEIVGTSGVFCIKTLLADIVKDQRIDFVLGGGDGATGGYGTGKNHSIYLHKLGVDVILGGECIYYKRDMVPHIAKAPYILRPANYPPENPGRGVATYTTKAGDLAVIVLLGQAGFDRVHLQNPFALLPKLVERVSAKTQSIVVDFHANTTAEKHAMFAYADGMVSAVIGTHTKVVTSDERIMPEGTAVITDVGRTGSIDSVGGLVPSIEIGKFLTQIPERSKDAWKRLELQAIILDIRDDGRATRIERIRVPVPGEAYDPNRNDT